MYPWEVETELGGLKFLLYPMLSCDKRSLPPLLGLHHLQLLHLRAMPIFGPCSSTKSKRTKRAMENDCNKRTVNHDLPSLYNVDEEKLVLQLLLIIGKSTVRISSGLRETKEHTLLTIT